MTAPRTAGRHRPELELFVALPDDRSPATMAELSSRLRRCVYWVINRMPGGHALAGEVEDIVAEAHLRLERLRARGFHGGALEFRTYLYKVVASACVEAANRRRLTDSLDAPVIRPDGDETPLGDLLHEMIDPHLSAGEAVEAAEARRRVRRALESLDERCRTLLRRFHLEGVPIKALAERERTRPNTIEVALTRCRTRLYVAFLGEYLAAPGDDLERHVARAAERLSGLLARVFRAWWTDNRSVLDISKEVGLTPAETKELLARAKVEVWLVIGEPGAR